MEEEESDDLTETTKITSDQAEFPCATSLRQCPVLPSRIGDES